MLLKCKKEQVNEVIEFIGSDKLKCFYLYMDLIEYGISKDDSFQLWEIKEGDKIASVAYVYYDCLHLFSKDENYFQEMEELIQVVKPKVINGTKGVIERIKSFYPEGSIKTEENYTITIHSDIERKDNYTVFQAQEENLDEITALMIADPVYSKVYTFDKLRRNLLERMNDSTGRTFYIRDEDGNIVATNSTYVETDELGVVGGLVTNPKMRGKGIGRAITAHTWNLIRSEGKQGVAYLEANNDSTIYLHKKMGFEFINLTARILLCN